MTGSKKDVPSGRPLVGERIAFRLVTGAADDPMPIVAGLVHVVPANANTFYEVEVEAGTVPLNYPHAYETIQYVSRQEIRWLLPHDMSRESIEAWLAE